MDEMNPAEMNPVEAETRRRMSTGELYVDFGPGRENLEEERLRGKELTAEFNAIPVRERAAATAKLREIFGSVGEGVWVEPPLKVAYGVNTTVGENVYVNFGLTLVDDAPVRIGDGVMFGPNVLISTAGHPIHPEPRATGEQFSAPVTIEDGAWIGGHVTILPGVTIGAGSVIAAGAVVTAHLPPNVVAGGVPARVLRRITDADREFVYREPRTLQIPGE